MSYAVVLTDDVSRQGIIDAFKKRHCYAATDNIVLDVRSGDHLMGDEFDTDEAARRSTIDVHGTGPVAKVHVIRDNKYVYSTEPKQRRGEAPLHRHDATAGQDAATTTSASSRPTATSPGRRRCGSRTSRSREAATR